MLTSINVQFIFDSARLGLFSSTNVPQIADLALRVVFLLFLPCFWPLFCLVPKTSEIFAILVFTTKTTQPHPQVFSVNSALTCSCAALLISLVD